LRNRKNRIRTIAFSVVFAVILSFSFTVTGAVADNESRLTPETVNDSSAPDSTAPDSPARTGSVHNKPFPRPTDRIPDGDKDVVSPDAGINLLPAATDGLKQDDTIADNLKQDESVVRALTENFGKDLRMVSLTAPKDAAAAQIKRYYSEYVTEELLQKWTADPQSAPGRMVSSPWPDRIEILTLQGTDENQYSVSGEIIEVTGMESQNGEAAAKRPVTLAIERENDRWLISDVTMGDYLQHGPVVYDNTRYGFRFYLPETWKGYSVVEEQWEGTPIATNGKGTGETGPKGPKISIRHATWTEDVPRQDIPILIFTREQWDALQEGKFSVGAAPIGPGKLGSNSGYVFALPARYNYSFPAGFEEVEEILKDHPLWTRNPTEPATPTPSPTGAPGTPEKRIDVEFDVNVVDDGEIYIYNPSMKRVMDITPEMEEQARKAKEEQIRKMRGIFRTELDITQQDEEAKLDVSLYNTSDRILKFGLDWGREFAFHVKNAEGEEIFKWPGDDLCWIQAISNHMLKSGEKLTFSNSWDYKDKDESRVPPGKYTVTVEMLPRMSYQEYIDPNELSATKEILVT